MIGFFDLLANVLVVGAVARIIGDAKLLDRAKTECGTRAVA